MKFRSSSYLFSSFALLVALLAPAGVQAQDKDQLNAAQGALVETESSAAVEAAALAAELAAYGREHQMPLALISAAQLLVEAGVQEEDRSKTEATGGAAATGQPDKAEGPGLDPAAILREASQLASGNEALEELIGSVRRLAEAGGRGRVGGAAYHTDIVRARTTDIYTIAFRGDQSARISVTGDGDTDLDCYVYDENGHLIDSDVDYSDRCTLAWRPRWTGPFRLEIRNLGRVWNAYTLTTN